MGWDAKDIALLNRLWSAGQSAAQIARRLGCSRNAVCGMLTRLGLKRGHKPPTATPKIRPPPKLRRRRRQPAPVQSHERCRGTQRRGDSPRNSASSSSTPCWQRRSETLAKSSPRAVALPSVPGPSSVGLRRVDAALNLASLLDDLDCSSRSGS
ncbi:GcrA family cell cycle regulator [Bradyrhizobium sp. SSUT77]|uniref:GcrA family cell cycle regulator n=1 Tax=Bradyrhizobium sp. SSUT77 TaxID=3040603 RepID=UPI00244CACC7|nr:GcrA family cell cycle regulator [Bradyrhizobium sp. SSUT77]MDH2347185.1 GcrA family cell cycle regulator [Bradyrhizobium sp. SSUT77]